MTKFEILLAETLAAAKACNYNSARRTDNDTGVSLLVHDQHRGARQVWMTQCFDGEGNRIAKAEAARLIDAGFVDTHNVCR